MIDPRMILLFILMEALLLAFFFWLNKKMLSAEEETTLQLKDVLKGILERLFLITGMMTGYPHVITAFAALKIGTRFSNSKVSNDYFLIGNLVSILAALLYVRIVTNSL